MAHNVASPDITRIVRAGPVTGASLGRVATPAVAALILIKANASVVVVAARAAPVDGCQNARNGKEKEEDEGLHVDN
jgi:hypothetical protein